MKDNAQKNYETALPDGYREVLRINAKDVKTAILFTLASLVPLALVLVIAFLAGRSAGLQMNIYQSTHATLDLLIWLAAIIAYLIFHELLHGAAYKKLTGQKLTFGISWSCAFCGVPNIYVYRKAVLIAVILPFAVFTVLFIPLTIAMFFVNGIAFFYTAILLGLHLGGCVGDLYVFYLLLFRYKTNTVLVRDTGPEQFIYM